MGVNLRELLLRKPVTMEDLAGKVLVVDGNNMLYQFLATIRQRDGALFTDAQGRVTSHLIGLFSRVTKMMQGGLKLAFVFDGEVPKLKHQELQRRREVKMEAERRYQEALESEDAQGMQKFAARTSRLTREMIAEARELLEALGIPVIQAPSEGEAQAAFFVRSGQAWAAVSQDYDSLLFGTPRLIQNLSLEGRRKVPGKLAFTKVEPLIIDLEENLAALGISQEKLIWLGILVGTDFAPQGVRGIGPKKGLALVKKHDTAESLFGEVQLSDDVDWREVLRVFKEMPVDEKVVLSWRRIDRARIETFLVAERAFGVERVQKVLDGLAPARQQKSLGDF
ncbi:flap endonuclease-1 [Candidatus Woesearchaeota archaeon]|nr:MAG: flap endonuclease-1 [Candidatus Woesearchaeota archaeon]